MSKLQKKKVKLCNISAQGYTGIAYYDHCFCESLYHQGVDVTFVTSDRWLADKQKPSYKIKFYFVNTYGNRSRAIKGINYLRGILKTFFYVIFNRINVVHFQLLELPIIDVIFFFLFRVFGVKVVYTPHDLVSFKFGENRTLLSLMFKFSNVLIVHNNPNEKTMREKYPSIQHKIRMIMQGNYNAFLTKNMTQKQAREQINLPQDKKIILVFGNIREGKGTETSVRAFYEIEDKTSLLLLVAGNPNRGYDMTPIRKMAEDVSMQGYVMMRDHFIEDEDVEAYYKAADIVLVPYERIYTSAVLVYAYSCAMACIVSEQKELLEFAEDGKDCVVFKVKDTKDLKEKMQMLLNDDALRKKIAENAGRKALIEWDWSKTAKQLKEIYENVL